MTLLSTGFSKRRPRALKTQKAELHATAANLRASCMPKVSAEKGGNVGADGRGAIRSDVQVPCLPQGRFPFVCRPPRFGSRHLELQAPLLPEQNVPQTSCRHKVPGLHLALGLRVLKRHWNWEGKCGGPSVPKTRVTEALPSWGGGLLHGGKT